MNIFRNAGKTIALLIFILILTFAGLLWFDYLGVIQAKKLFAPVYRLLGLQAQTSTSATLDSPLLADLDEDRLAKRLEALTLHAEELKKRETDISALEEANRQIAEELEQRRLSQDEKEKTFNNVLQNYDNVDTNVAQTVRNLNSMPPQNAVNILLAMDDQDVIDILRKAEEIAQAANTSSLGSTWLMMMPPDRAAQIQRKMQRKPASLD